MQIISPFSEKNGDVIGSATPRLCARSAGFIRAAAPVDWADALREGESGDARGDSVERGKIIGVILYLLPLFLIAENDQNLIDTNGLGQCGTSQTRFLLWPLPVLP